MTQPEGKSVESQTPPANGQSHPIPPGSGTYVTRGFAGPWHGIELPDNLRSVVRKFISPKSVRKPPASRQQGTRS